MTFFFFWFTKDGHAVGLCGTVAWIVPRTPLKSGEHIPISYLFSLFPIRFRFLFDFSPSFSLLAVKNIEQRKL